MEISQERMLSNKQAWLQKPSPIDTYSITELECSKLLAGVEWKKIQKDSGLRCSHSADSFMMSHH